MRLTDGGTVSETRHFSVGSVVSPRLAWSRGGSTIAAYDYGTVPLGNAVVKMFTLTNSGTGPSGQLTTSLANSTGAALSINSSDDFCSGVTLALGKSCDVDVAFTPATKSEADSGALSAGGARVSLSGSGGPQALTLDVGALLGTDAAGAKLYDFSYFGSVAFDGTTYPQTFTVANGGVGSSEQINVVNTSDAKFGFVDDCVDSVLGSGETCTF